MNFNNRSGFSMTELMVAISIIAILIAVSVPSYIKFQAKAKQANAKSELAGVYTAEKSFFTEYGRYHANLPYVGYVPDGVPINYNASNGGSTVNVGCPIPYDRNTQNWPTRYYTVGFASGADDQVFGLAAPPCPTTYNFQATTPLMAANTSSGGANGLRSTASISADLTQFTAEASGYVAEGSGKLDRWVIDENRRLINEEIGI